ncbi:MULTISPECIES: TIGR03986 family CRISPR-associated RAMP protein [unclassified Desulfovibrio]|uniref:TIGR03986 family type III CRISPR-associated RAMP protein n=1 Tax=unclassified Desulfovibrio TaxID=2593640 RepID=UPI0013EA79AD|nr:MULTISPECIES: TIGR03986 family CRISPR-associated RAMP protein [unclassified Desulfovibrio]
MEEYTGRLIINQTKKGGLDYRVEFTNRKGKTVDFPVHKEARCFNTGTVASGDEAHFQLEGSKVLKCTVPGKEAPCPEEPVKAPRPGGAPGRDFTRPSPGATRATGRPEPVMGKAPYNFVRYMPSAVVPAPGGDEGRWSGEILCRLTAETPLLVSGRQVKDDSGATCAFQRVGGLPVIPGTAVKGMLRAYMEILSFSGLRPVSKKWLFWRTVAENKDGSYYHSLFSSKDILGGFLRKNGADFSIIPVEVKKKARHAPEEAGWEKVMTGGIKTMGVDSASYFFRLPEQGARALPLDRDIVLRLRDQLTPDQEKRWPKDRRHSRLASHPGLPVFYREKNGAIVELGFCRYFRVQYEHSPHDLAWPDPSVEKVRDLARAIFGHAEKNSAEAGRVAVESFHVHGEPWQGGAPVRTVGAGPKPGCIPFYLVQGQSPVKVISGGRKNSRESMSNYDTRGARLRGRKLYWHHDADPQFFPKGNENKKLALRLLPLAPGAGGDFVIRVERLSDIELGCLLEALELKPDCRHKLGMGKPLGFGSVKLEIREARLSDVRRKYASLAGRLGSPRPVAMPAGEREALRAAFRQYVLDAAAGFYPGAPVRDYYQLPPIRDLFRLLDWEHRPTPRDAANMTLEEFGNNPLLPLPEQVV